MSYCPNCGEDGIEYTLECGCQKCEDCITERELLDGICRECRESEEET